MARTMSQLQLHTNESFRPERRMARALGIAVPAGLATWALVALPLLLSID